MIKNFKDEKNKRKSAYKNYDMVRKLIKEYLKDKRFCTFENEKKKEILTFFMYYVHDRILLNMPPFETSDGVVNLDVYKDYLDRL